MVAGIGKISIRDLSFKLCNLPILTLASHMCAVQEPVGKWQEVEGDGDSGTKKGSNLLELFYADPKRCVSFFCVIWYTPTGPLRIRRFSVDPCNLQSFQGECVMCPFLLSNFADSLFCPTGGPIPFKPTLS